MRLLDADSVPDPMTDFPGFVRVLYENRGVMRLETLEDAIQYVDGFCPSPPGGFFLHSFVFSLSNPVLLSVALNRMEMTGHPMWVEFTDQEGSVERVFDLFLIFLNPSTDVSEDQHWVFRVNMANLLASLLYRCHMRLVLVAYLAQTLFERLLLMVKAAPEETAIILLRNAIRIGPVALRYQSRSAAISSFNGLFATSTKPGSLVRGTVINWARAHVGSTIPPRTFCQWMLGLRPDCPRDLELLAKVAIEFGGNALVLVFQNFCRGMVRDKIWTRTYAQLLVELIPYACENNPLMRRWFATFLSRTVMFICLAVWKSQYRRRVFVVVTVLASNLFRGEPWAWDVILSATHAAFSGGMQFFANFFDYEPDREVNEGWIEEFKLFRAAKARLKYLPFKKATRGDLVWLTESDGQICTSALYTVVSSKEVLALDVPGHLRHVFHFTPDQTASERNQVLFDLEDLIDPEDKSSPLKSKRELPPLPPPRKILSDLRFAYTGLYAVHNALDARWREFMSGIAKEFEISVREAIRVVRENPRISVSLDLVRGLAHPLNKAADVREFCKVRNRIRERLAVILGNATGADLLPNLRELIGQMVMKINPVIIYTRSSRIEKIMAEILGNAEEFTIREPLVSALITANTTSALKEAINALRFEISNLIRFANEQNTQVIFNALIRIRFSLAYAHGEDDLRRFPKADREFFMRCAAFAAKPVGDLRLPPGFISREVHAMPISKYFKSSKLIPISGIQFIGNPLDVLSALHQVVTALTGFFSRAKPGPEQLRVLFLALLARDPPVNSFSIAKWLEKWDGLMLSRELDRAKTHFLAAITTLLPDPPKE
jgi:hypothetical protein